MRGLQDNIMINVCDLLRKGQTKTMNHTEVLNNQVHTRHSLLSNTEQRCERLGPEVFRI